MSLPPPKKLICQNFCQQLNGYSNTRKIYDKSLDSKSKQTETVSPDTESCTTYKMSPIDLSYKKNVIDNTKQSCSPHQYTLQLDSVFGDDQYLLSMWKQCELIDTFFYSNCPDPDVTKCFIPAHRLVICAYSQYCMRFFETYPKQTKLFDHIQTLLSANDTTNCLADGCRKHISPLTFGCASIPVITLNIPHQDLQDLVTLMYHGTVKIDSTRLTSIIQSANTLQMKKLYLIELKQYLHDIEKPTIIERENNNNNYNVGDDCEQKSINTLRQIGTKERCNFSCTCCWYFYNIKTENIHNDHNNDDDDNNNNNNTMRKSLTHKWIQNNIHNNNNTHPAIKQDMVDVKQSTNQQLMNASQCTNIINGDGTVEKSPTYVDSISPESTQYSNSEQSCWSTFGTNRTTPEMLRSCSLNEITKQHMKSDIELPMISHKIPSVDDFYQSKQIKLNDERNCLLKQLSLHTLQSQVFQKSLPEQTSFAYPVIQRQQSAPAELHTDQNDNAAYRYLYNSPYGYRSSSQLDMITGKYFNIPNTIDEKVDEQNGGNRKKTQNTYHAAKYRDRRRQRIEQLFGEKDNLEKLQNIHLKNVNEINISINELIRTRTIIKTNNGQYGYKCPVCRTMFRDVDTIRQHLKHKHQQQTFLHKHDTNVRFNLTECVKVSN